MRVKNFTSKTYILAMGLLCAATLHLYFRDRLDYYIHPRFELFAFFFSLIGVVLSIYILFHDESRLEKRDYLLVVIVVLVIMMPISALSSRTAKQRGINQAVSGNTSSAFRFGNNLEHLSIKDWVSILNNTDKSIVVGKKAKLVGFITKSDTENVYYVSRFIISCCSIDAQPIGVPVLIQDEQYYDNQWVEVYGTFQQNPSTSDNELVVIPTEISEISTPENPYEYF